jgi:hypothetical protein
VPGSRSYGNIAISKTNQAEAGCVGQFPLGYAVGSLQTEGNCQTSFIITLTVLSARPLITKRKPDTELAQQA